MMEPNSEIGNTINLPTLIKEQQNLAINPNNTLDLVESAITENAEALELTLSSFKNQSFFPDIGKLEESNPSIKIVKACLDTQGIINNQFLRCFNKIAEILRLRKIMQVSKEKLTKEDKIREVLLSVKGPKEGVEVIKLRENDNLLEIWSKFRGYSSTAQIPYCFYFFLTDEEKKKWNVSKKGAFFHFPGERWLRQDGTGGDGMRKNQNLSLNSSYNSRVSESSRISKNNSRKNLNYNNYYNYYKKNNYRKNGGKKLFASYSKSGILTNQYQKK